MERVVCVLGWLLDKSVRQIMVCKLEGALRVSRVELVFGMCSLKLNVKTKLFEWTAGCVWRIDLFVGGSCQLVGESGFGFISDCHYVGK